jgi:RHS repeat-associated protein
VSGTSTTNNYATQQTGCTYYANAQLHAVRQSTQGGTTTSYCYDANGNLTSLGGSPITWTSYNQPSVLYGGTSTFAYDHNHLKWLQVAAYSGYTETTEYIGGLLEKVTNANGTSYRYYVPAGNNTVVYSTSGSSSGSINYVTTDHLGSSAVITNSAGQQVVHETFSALGARENTGSDLTAIAGVTRVGFTGQSEMDNVGLVNMNGRVYNPGGSHFLSPDPTVPHPTDTRSYNRFAYARYNSLRYVDPSGFVDKPCVTGDTCPGDSGGDGEVVLTGNSTTGPSSGVTVTSGTTLDPNAVQQAVQQLPDSDDSGPPPAVVPPSFAGAEVPPDQNYVAGILSTGETDTGPDTGMENVTVTTNGPPGILDQVGSVVDSIGYSAVSTLGGGIFTCIGGRCSDREEFWKLTQAPRAVLLGAALRAWTAGQALFYSGGMPARMAVQAAATPGTRLLNLPIDLGYFGNSVMSGLFAATARGNVEVFLSESGVDAGGIWSTTESTVLSWNPFVTGIATNIVDGAGNIISTAFSAL